MGPNFLDPQTSSDGSPYAPKHYEELVKQCWFVSDRTNTSYADVLDLSYSERCYLIRFIKEKEDAQVAWAEEQKRKQAAVRPQRINH